MLTTLANVKTYLGIDTSDNTQNGLINLLIPSIQSTIENYCNRHFDITAYVKEQHNVNHKIFTRETPIVSVESIIRLDANLIDTIPDTNGMTNYRLFPGYVELLDYKYLTIGNKLKYLNNEESYVEISYTAGYKTIPLELSLVAMKMIAQEFKITTEGTMGLLSYMEGTVKEVYREDEMTPSIKKTLDRYKRVSL